MDYLEGLFLGKLWSDTDFENRKHVALFLLYGLFVDAIVLYSYFTGRFIAGLGNAGILQYVIYAVLFLACPFICFKYYRMPFWGKLIVLLEKFLKAVLVVNFTATLVLPRLTVKSSGLQDFLVTYLNGTLETYTEKMYSSAGTFATVLGVITGGIHVVFVFVLVLLAAILLPGLVFFIFRFIQFGYDWIINKAIIKRFLVKNRK